MDEPPRDANVAWRIINITQGRRECVEAQVWAERNYPTDLMWVAYDVTQRNWVVWLGRVLEVG